MTVIEVIVAVRNEEQSIPVFLDTLAALALPQGVDLRVVFVEDSSTDGTRPLLQRLARENPKVSYYSLVKGFGQGLAVTFGLSRSTADAMVMMDVDGSHPVSVIPEMIRAFLGGAQVVQCVRRTLSNRKAYRRMGAAGFQIMARLLTGTDTTEQNIFYRLVSANVARQLVHEPRYWRWLRFPLPRRPEGALRKIEIDTEERRLGESKYGFLRLVTLGIDGMLSLIAPPRLIGISALAGLIGILLIRAGWWPPAAAIVLVIVALVSRYVRLQNADVLGQMRVLDCGGTQDMADAQVGVCSR
jgi:glycosyltransferase involved in cell wall biosynthesis